MAGGGPVSVPKPSSPGWAVGPLCKKCQAQVPNFLPFVRLCRDLEFTETLAAPNNTHMHPLEKSSLPAPPGSSGFFMEVTGVGVVCPGLRNGSSSCISFLKKPSLDRAWRGQNPRCGTGLVSHQPGAPIPPASPEALGFYCSRMGCNQCQEYLSAYREAKIWVICLRT